LQERNKEINNVAQILFTLIFLIFIFIYYVPPFSYSLTKETRYNKRKTTSIKRSVFLKRLYYLVNYFLFKP
ncbi:hypothetical protein, partial [Borrelia coriaceae]|uniref:hypothetical protein n=1 Tax=Borrelia coriaceae TaxID=144 RepID=UPI001B7FC737